MIASDEPAPEPERPLKLSARLLAAALAFTPVTACYIDARSSAPPPAAPAEPSAEVAAPAAAPVEAGEVAATTTADATNTPAKPACSVEGWVSDPDPNGLNVRETPGGKVIGRVPFGDRGPEGVGPAPTVEVVGVSGSWLQISGRNGVTPGWVHASMINVQIAYAGANGGEQPLRAGPSDGAKVVGSIAPEYSAVIKDCAPGWVKLDIPDAGKSGWIQVSRTCSASNTTCPG